jgi:hypothetical protein
LKNLFSGYEIESPGKMTERTVPVPPDRPCAERDDDVFPVQIVIPHFFGEHKVVGGEAPISIQIFLNFILNIVEFRFDSTIVTYLASMMGAAAPDGTPPRRIDD